MKLPSGLFASEIPVDGDAVAADAVAPGLDFVAQCSEVRDSALLQALAAEQTHFDFSLVAPAAVLGCVVNCELVPEQSAQLLAVALHQHRAAMRIQIVQNRVDGAGVRAARHDLHQVIAKIRLRARGCGIGEMPSRLRCHAAKDVGYATAPVLVIAPGYLSWPGGLWTAPDYVDNALDDGRARRSAAASGPGEAHRRWPAPIHPRSSVCRSPRRPWRRCPSGLRLPLWFGLRPSAAAPKYQLPSAPAALLRSTIPRYAVVFASKADSAILCATSASASAIVSRHTPEE